MNLKYLHEQLLNLDLFFKIGETFETIEEINCSAF